MCLCVCVCVCVCVRVRERERGREGGRERDRQTDGFQNFVNICPCNLLWPVSLSRPSLYLTSEQHGSSTESANLKEDITSKVTCRSIYIY